MAPTRIPTFLLRARIGLINTYWPLVLPDWFCGSTCYVFLLRQLFLTPRIVPRKRPGGVLTAPAGSVTLPASPKEIERNMSR